MQTFLVALAAIPEFMVAVLTSLAGWLTGGIIGAVWWAWEHWSGTTSWKAVKRGIAAFLLVACFSVWYEQRDTYIKSQVAVKGFQDQLQKEQSKVENRDGQITGLQNQIQNQQRTINEALVQLGKAQQQEPLKFNAYSLGNVDRRSPELEIASFVVIPNRQVAPVRLLAACDGEIIDAAWRMLGTLGLTLGGMVKTEDKKQRLMEVSSPAWTPTNPMLVTVYSKHKEMHCSFSQR